jgi:hypothetical protein
VKRPDFSAEDAEKKVLEKSLDINSLMKRDIKYKKSTPKIQARELSKREWKSKNIEDIDFEDVEKERSKKKESGSI